MPKRHWFLSALLILSLLSIGSISVYAQGTPSLVDTVEVSSIIYIPTQTTVAVEVRLKTPRDLTGLSIPLKFRSAEGDTALDINCDSIHWSDWVMDYPPITYTGQDTFTYVDSTEKTIVTFAMWSGLYNNYLHPGSGTIFTIYFTTGASWDTDVAVRIDTFSTMIPPISLYIVDIIPDNWIPVYIPGFLGGEFTPENGDVNCDNKIAIEDIVYLVRYIFKSGPPPCD